jgi:hypothetical protein
MADYSRSVHVKPFMLLAGDLVRLLQVVAAKALGTDPDIKLGWVNFREMLPDGTGVTHPPGDMSLLQRVCTIPEGTEISLFWKREGERELYLSIRTLLITGVNFYVSASSPGILNDAIDVILEALEPEVSESPKDESPGLRKLLDAPVETKTKETPKTESSDLKKVHIDGIYKILAAVAAGLVGIVWWKLTH